LLNFSAIFIEVFIGGPYFDRWYSDFQVLSIISGCYDLSNILPDGLDSAKALKLLNSANAKNPLLSGLDSGHGSEAGIYRMNFTVYNMDKVRKGRKFYYVCSDKENSPLALTSAGAQLVFEIAWSENLLEKGLD
jgi:hypothetical protein